MAERLVCCKSMTQLGHNPIIPASFFDVAIQKIFNPYEIEMSMELRKYDEGTEDCEETDGSDAGHAKNDTVQSNELGVVVGAAARKRASWSTGAFLPREGSSIVRKGSKKSKCPSLSAVFTGAQWRKNRVLCLSDRAEKLGEDGIMLLDGLTVPLGIPGDLSNDGNSDIADSFQTGFGLEEAISHSDALFFEVDWKVDVEHRAILNDGGHVLGGELFGTTPSFSSCATSACSTDSGYHSLLDQNGFEPGRCLHQGCGKRFKDLKAHMLTHASERPEKCIFIACEYHQKGFARKYDRNRHIQSHFKGEIICPGRKDDTTCGRRFKRLDMFKRHLALTHSKAAPGMDSSSTCSLCSVTFACIEDFSVHLNDCVLRILETEACAQPVEVGTEKSTDPWASPFDSPLSPTNSLASGSMSSGELSFIAGPGSRHCLEITLDTIDEAPEVLALEDHLAQGILDAFSLWKLQGEMYTQSPSQFASESSSTSASNSHGSAASTFSSYTSNSTQDLRSLKRSRDDEEGGGPTKQPRNVYANGKSYTAVPRRLLACPYAKYDRTRYSECNQTERHYRGCSSSYLRDISRLKQHLYRVHRRPTHHCLRCYIDFSSEDDLILHSRQVNCLLAQCPFEEKMKHDQFLAVKRREMGRDAERVWFDIFGILFPGTVPPSSPYTDHLYDAGEIDHFLDFFEREAPGRIASTATPMLCGSDLPRELQEMTEQILETCISALIQRYRDGSLQSLDAANET